MFVPSPTLVTLLNNMNTSHITQSLELMLKLAKMDISQLIQAREATDNPKFHKILD